MNAPAPTPAQKALARVLTISRFDGWSVLIIALLGALLSLLIGEWLGTALGLLVAGAGVMEIRGNKMLKRRNVDGMKWLVRSQMYLLSLVLAYCASRLGSFDAGYLKEQVIPELRQNLLALGLNLNELLAQFDLTTDQLVPLVHKAFFALYGGLAFITLIYQGGMALWYRAKIPLVTAALTVPPLP